MDFEDVKEKYPEVKVNPKNTKYGRRVYSFDLNGGERPTDKELAVLAYGYIPPLGYEVKSSEVHVYTS